MMALALIYLIQAGRTRPGHRCLFNSFGSGINSGAQWAGTWNCCHCKALAAVCKICCYLYPPRTVPQLWQQQKEPQLPHTYPIEVGRLKYHFLWETYCLGAWNNKGHECILSFTSPSPLSSAGSSEPLQVLLSIVRGPEREMMNGKETEIEKILILRTNWLAEEIQFRQLFGKKKKAPLLKIS